MKVQLNFHRQMAEPMVCAFRSNYGPAGQVYGVRLGWSALTLSLYKGA